MRKILSWQRLDHLDICRLYDMKILPIPQFEMELCSGSLEDLPKRMDIERPVNLMLQIVNGMKHAHDLGIVHRDLKPWTILMRGDVFVVSDWALSKVASSDSHSKGSGFTPLYAGPEQTSPQQFGNTDHRTDIYQMGVIFQELVVGRPAYDGVDTAEIVAQVIGGEPPLPARFRRYAGEVDKIIMRCLEQQMEDRYQSIADLEENLRGYFKV